MHKTKAKQSSNNIYELYPRTDDRNVCNRWTGRQLYFAGNYSNAVLLLTVHETQSILWFGVYFSVFYFLFDCILRFDLVKLLFNLKLDDLDDSSTMFIAVYAIGWNSVNRFKKDIVDFVSHLWM